MDGSFFEIFGRETRATTGRVVDGVGVSGGSTMSVGRAVGVGVPEPVGGVGVTVPLRQIR